MGDIRGAANVLVSTVTKTLAMLIPKKKGRWIFGAWYGDRVSDNTKAISDYIVKNYPEIEVVWVTNNPDSVEEHRCKVIKRNSLASLKYILTAQVAFMNQGYADFSSISWLGGCISVQLWHGVAWKKIGEDAAGFDRTLLSLSRYVSKYDYYIAPADNYAEILKSAFNVGNSKIIKIGQPRNDLLYSGEYCVECKKKIINDVGCGDCKIVVYLPTFRDNKVLSFSFLDEKVKKVIEEYNFTNVLFIEKKHYVDIGRVAEAGSSEKRIILGNKYDTQDLLAAADILITDYSSCLFDYLITNRPIIHYIYDYEYYSDMDRGLYYDLDEVLCGDAPRNIDDLCKSIQNNLTNPSIYEELRKIRMAKYISYESNHNSETIVETILESINIK